MELKYYLSDSNSGRNKKLLKNKFVLGNHIAPFDENLVYDKNTIAIVGINDYTNNETSAIENCANLVRKHLNDLYHYPDFPPIIDVGNIKKGKSQSDTEHAIEFVLTELLKRNITPLIIGAKYYSNLIYNVLSKKNSKINLVAIEPSLSLEINKENEHSYLEKIIFDKNKSLNNFTNIGYQSYYVYQKEIDLLKKLQINAIRLGVARNNLLEIEPVLRDADHCILDMSAIKHSDAPGVTNAQPNGFYSEEICQLAKYAGMSNRIKAFSLCELNPEYDVHDQTMKLAAQILWHVIDGFANYRNDHPGINKLENFTEFIVNVSGLNEEIKFYKNNRTLRWWFKTPSKYTHNKDDEYIACSLSDYQKARNNEIPQRFLDVINRSY